MSYDLAVWDGELLRGDEAGAVFDALYERYLGSDVIAELSPRIETYVEALLERYPDDVAGSPGASPAVIGAASGPIVFSRLLLCPAAVRR
jgi:hypothetical protein